MSVTHSPREIIEGAQHQGKDESIVYSLDTTNWGASPGSLSMVVIDTSTDADVTAVVTTGSVTAVGNIITLKTLTSLTSGITYRVEVKFTIGSNIFEAYFYVIGED